MGWRKIVAFALGALVVAVVAESHFGSTRYKLNGAAYSVPHQYEFARNFRLPWLESAEGLEKEPDESVWLLIPSHEMAREVPSYKRQFHGYSDDVEADVVVQILGGKTARRFAIDRKEALAGIEREIAQQGRPQIEKTTGWIRVPNILGADGKFGAAGLRFSLVPFDGISMLPANWMPPSCQASQDVDGIETYDCDFVIYRDGLSFDFTLRRENLNTAGRMPDFFLARLRKWRN